MENESTSPSTNCLNFHIDCKNCSYKSLFKLQSNFNLRSDD